MKLIYQSFLWALVGTIVYLAIIGIGVTVFLNVDISTFFWGLIFPIIVIVIAFIGGGVFWFKAIALYTNPMVEPEYDLGLLAHEVINQLESDFECEDFEGMDDMIRTLLKNERPNHEVMYDFLSESARQNLKEELTAKRNEN